MASTISRYDYSAMYGPTTGDKIRLADTDLFIEVEKIKYPVSLLDKPLNQKNIKNA